jgi:Cd2+/Zn2+-exporting ATPase
MAFFGGIGCAARSGILFKGANIFSPLSKARYFAFDKTGTLTKARLRVSSVEPVGVSEDELLSLVRRAEYYSNHPVAEAVKRDADNILPPDSAEEIVGEGVLCQIGESKIFVGNMRLMKRLGIEVTPSEYTALYCVENSRFVGKILLTDTVKEEAAVAISSLRTLGVEKCIMISGDRERAAAETALAVGIDGYHAEITPEGKYELVKALVKEKGSLVFVGDGINDSPSLAAASVGIAMGGVGQDAAIEAADLIIVSDNLEKIPKAIKIARKTGRIAKENIVIALGVKLLVMLLGAVGIANMWLAVFADVGVAVIAILNSMRMLISGKREK